MHGPLAMKKKASIAVALALVGVFATTFSLLAATTTTASFAQNATTATSNNATATSNNATATSNNATATSNNATGAVTLGKQILQETGHIVVNRVTGVNNTAVTIESTYTDKGTFKGATPVTDMGTVTYTTNIWGQVTGKGQGLLRSQDGSMAGYKVKYMGSEDIHGMTNIQGTLNFTSLATGQLGSLHGTDLVFKVQTDTSGNSQLKAWEIKH